ncbi:MAG: glycoside hydrolase family 125 protein [Alphaproteobacteria bacterium]|nr:glycoside hydrolase family 125 protein [Alphaproteobacteria bacterium]
MLPSSMLRVIDQVSACFPQHPRLREMFARCFANTYETTLRPQADGSVHVITGDIPAMWLRDSAAQVRPYLALAKTDPAFTALIAGVVRRQMAFVAIDPYANAFNEAANGRCHNRDATDMGPWIWERKYELDSLCAPLLLAHDLWRETGDASALDANFISAAHLIIETITREQDHTASPYRFQRLEGPASDTLVNDGRGAPVGPTGMSWCGFRPSDDACRYNYLVPANMMAVVALRALAALPLGDEVLKAKALALAASLDAGIAAHGKVAHPRFGTVYAYEVDGLGHHHFMDDANVPSLLSLPYLGYCAKDDPVYLATRALVLSDANPYFHRGLAAKGIGSPHTPEHSIWPIALCMQGLTSTSRDEQMALLETLLATDAGTGLMHESFHKDDPTTFTRPWFAWANSLFAEFVMALAQPGGA